MNPEDFVNRLILLAYIFLTTGFMLGRVFR